VEALLGPQNLLPCTMFDMFDMFDNFHVHLSKNCKDYMKNHVHRKLHWTFAYKKKKVSKKFRPTLKKPKIGNFGRPPQGAKILFQDFEYTTFFRTFRRTSGVKIKEIEGGYFF
jgi:hypothetical protein